MSLIKLANLALERQRFLEDYNLKNPDVFSNDPVAQKAIGERKRLAERQIQNYFKQQGKASGILSPEMKELEQKMLNDLTISSNQAAQNFSIDRTRAVASQNPDQFKHFQSLSGQSQKALGKSHDKEVGSLLGAVGGAGLGLLAGRKLPKRNTGLLQRIGSGVVGGVTGGVTGGVVGSARDEKKTGFNHEDVLAPHQIADRMTNRQKFRS